MTTKCVGIAKLLLHRGCLLVLHDANPAIPSNRRSSIADDERVQVATCIQGLLQHGCTFILVAVPEDALDAVLYQLTDAAKQLRVQETATFCSAGFAPIQALTARMDADDKKRCCTLRFRLDTASVVADYCLLDDARRRRLSDMLSAIGVAASPIRLDLKSVVNVKATKKTLAQVMASSEVLPLVEGLDLSGCQVDDATLALFCRRLKDGLCPSLQRLDLSWNGISTVGMNAFARELAHEAFAHLTHLNLLFNNDDEGFDGLAKVLRRSTPRARPKAESTRRRWSLSFCGLLSGRRGDEPSRLPIPLAELRELRVALHSGPQIVALERAIRNGALPSLTRLDIRHGYTLDIDGGLARARRTIMRLERVHVTCG